MHAQHMDIILIFARTRDVGLYRPCLHCLHEKKTDMEQFGKILIVDDNEDVLFASSANKLEVLEVKEIPSGAIVR